MLDDRDELARICRLCACYDTHVGFYIDAVDNNKFSIPTTARYVYAVAWFSKKSWVGLRCTRT